MLVRTNIYLPQQLIRQLKHKAKATSTSMSDLIRTAVEEKQQKDAFKNNAAASLLKLAKQARKGSGIKDLSTNHDYYLANEPKDE